MAIYQENLRALEQRMVDFSVSVVTTCGQYSANSTPRPLIDQLIRSATSIGANYAEANNSSSRNDFRNKIYIAKKESGEARYWLRVLSAVLKTENLNHLQQECLELNLILQKITSTLKSGAPSDKSANGKQFGK